MVSLGIEAVRVLEVGVREAELRGLVVHHLNKGRLGAADRNGHLGGGVVGGEHEHDTHEVPERRRHALVIPGNDGILRQRDIMKLVGGIEGGAALERNDGRHDLRDGSHIDLGVGILAKEHVSLRVHDHGGLGLRKLGLAEVLGHSGTRCPKPSQNECDQRTRKRHHESRGPSRATRTEPAAPSAHGWPLPARDTRERWRRPQWCTQRP